MPGAWSTADTITKTLRDAQGLADMGWVVSYFAKRRAPASLPAIVRDVPLPDRALRLAGLDGPLHVTADSGGLATYYEIVTQNIYGRISGFMPGPGDVVVDVGANIGVFSLLAAGKVGATGKVIAIEPHPLAFSLLERNLRPFADRTELVNAACDEQPGEAPLYFVPGRLSVSSVVPRHDRVEKVAVAVRTLDDILSEHAPSTIDLLKVDVEGVEEGLLRGAEASLSRVRRMVMESDVHALPGVTAILEQSGLKPVGEVGGMWNLSAARIAYFSRDD